MSKNEHIKGDKLMERNTKRVIAIVIIAGLAVGGGYGIWYLFLQEGAPGVSYPWSAADCPGAPSTITSDQIIKIGVMGDMGTSATYAAFGDSIWNAVNISVQQINQNGGVKIGPKTYYYGITYEDTDELVIDAAKAKEKGERMVNYKQPDVVIGGFRTEMVEVYAPIIMKGGIPFLSTGAATDYFCANYVHNGLLGSTTYEAWQLYFRVMPLSFSNMAQQIGDYVIELMEQGVLNQTVAATEGEKPGFAIVREDLEWNKNAYGVLVDKLVAAGFHQIIDASYNFTASATTPTSTYTLVMEGLMQDLVDEHTATGRNSCIIPLISQYGSGQLSAAYSSIKPNAVVCGINVPSQSRYWSYATGGNCTYEINFLACTNGVNKTPDTVPFWQSYQANYAQTWPSYTGIGAFDAVRLFHAAVDRTKSTTEWSIKAFLESLTPAYTVRGAGGELCFDADHDLYYGYPNGYGLFCQWNATSAFYPGPNPLRVQMLLESTKYAGGNFNSSSIQMPSWWVY